MITHTCYQSSDPRSILCEAGTIERVRVVALQRGAEGSLTKSGVSAGLDLKNRKDCSIEILGTRRNPPGTVHHALCLDFGLGRAKG